MQQLKSHVRHDEIMSISRISVLLLYSANSISLTLPSWSPVRGFEDGRFGYGAGNRSKLPETPPGSRESVSCLYEGSFFTNRGFFIVVVEYCEIKGQASQPKR